MAGISGSNIDEAAMADISGSDTDEAAEGADNGSHVSGILKDDYYKNWVKGAEGLVLLQRGLAPFVDREIHNKHALFLNKLQPPCIQRTTGCGCTFQNILPDHAINLCHLRNCFCKGRGRRKCPNQGYCSIVCQLILNEHRTADPLWKNSDINTWLTDHWSIAKCYMTTPTPSNSAQTTDASGLLSVIINGKFFQSRILSPLGQPADVFVKARKMRNDVLHRAKMELTDPELQDILDTFIAVLEDPTSLLHDQDAASAVKQLKSLKNDQFKICTEEEIRILYERKEALRKLIQEETIKCMQSIEEARSEAVKSVDGKIKQVLDNLNLLNEETKQKIQNTESGILESIDNRENKVMNDLSSLKEEMLNKIGEAGSGVLESLDEKLNKILNELSEFREETIEIVQRSGSAATESLDAKLEKVTEDLTKIIDDVISNKTEAAAVQKRLDELGDRLRNTEEKLQISLTCKVESSNVDGGIPETKQERLKQNLADIRRQLANHLWKHYTTTSISPLKTRENDVDIDEVYTEPDMKIERKATEQNKDQRDITKWKYRDIIETEGTRLKRIYVIGEVGTGKTAFCQFLINKWCKFIVKDSRDNSEVWQIMKPFDFVFYLPLRRLQTSGNLKEMIKWYYRNEVPPKMMDYILSELSEKCLILADGLDEWKPSPGAERPVHVTDGIPDAEDMKDVTLITTSRQSALGVLNMKSTEYDRKIILSGIKRQSVYTMAERYCAKLDTTNKEDVLKRLKDLKVKDIANMPLILKQIVWILRKKLDITPGISGLYSDIVKIAVKWAYDKYKQELSHFKLNSRFAKFRLPEQLSKAPFIKECQNLVLSLSEIAFEMFTRDSNLAFGRCKLREYGIDDCQLKALLSVGLLSEDNFDNPLEEDTQFCFPHTSFIEYFSAVFIASQVQTCRTLTDEAENHSDSTNCLTKIFRKCRSIEDVFRMEIVMKFVCGLAPDLTQCVCQNIYSIAESCNELSRVREENCRLRCYNVLKVLEVQCLIAKCVTEHKKSSSSVTLRVPICDSVALNESFLNILKHVEGQSVQHLFVSVDEGRAFRIDCSGLKHLKELYLCCFCDPQETILSNVQTTRLERVVLCGQLIPELLKGEPCKTLQELFLKRVMLHCPSEVSGLLNLIARTTTLRVIKILFLIGLECDEHCRHVMDLSQLDKLQKFELSYSPAILVKVTNKSNLETVHFDKHSSECFGELRGSQKLHNLTINSDCNIRTVLTKEMNEDICTCTQLQCLKLVNVDVQDDALQLHSGMENLSNIKLRNVLMSESTYMKFVESLLTLKQSVTISVCLSEECLSELSKYESYIQSNPEKFNIFHTGFGYKHSDSNPNSFHEYKRKFVIETLKLSIV